MKRLFRKIHLWLSVPFGIFITLICFSGATLVFEKEITEWCRPDLYFVGEVKERPLPLSELMERVSATLPDSVSVTGVTIYPDAERTYQVVLSKPRRASLYVNQYTGEIAGRSERLPFFDAMFHLHRWMMGSSSGFGKLLVGISTLALVAIIITGLLMWLTNKHRPLRKSLTISVTKGWPRFWHDMHVAGGIYATIFLLAFALTGLTWSFSWYRTGFYNLLGAETSAGHGPSRQESRSGKHGSAPAADVPLKNRGGKREHGGLARGGHDGRQTPDRHERPATSPENRQDAPPTFSKWQEAYEYLAKNNPGYRQITVSEGTATVVPSGRASLRAGDRFDFDPVSGKITGSTPYSEQDQSAKVRGIVYTVHVGSWGGTATRILSLIAALLGATLPLTGYYLWLKRLRKKAVRNKS